jgi:hypothetical protein
MPMRISAASPARVTQPTYEKLKAQLATLDKKINTASKALQDHKNIMMRSRYTPEGLKVATAKLKTFEKDLAKLQTQRKHLVAQMAVIRPASKPPTAAALRQPCLREPGWAGGGGFCVRRVGPWPWLESPCSPPPPGRRTRTPIVRSS